MAKKLNGMAKWIVVGIALLTVAFNSGVTYNHVRHLSIDVEKLERTIEKMDDKIDKINMDLARFLP